MARPTDDLPKITRDELEERVLYSMLGPAARLARAFATSLHQITDLAEMAYFHELKEKGLKLTEAADVLQVSRRKAAQLSQTLKQNFARPEREHGLPRRIEFMLWAGPLTEGRIIQALHEDDEQQVLDALELLVSQERIVRQPGRTVSYEVPRSEFRLYREDWMARIDGLNNLLGNAANAIYARFFKPDADAFARTLSFRIRKQDLPRLKELYEKAVWQTLRDLDEQAKDDPDAAQMDLSILWAPYQFIETQNGGNDDE